MAGDRAGKKPKRLKDLKLPRLNDQEVIEMAANIHRQIDDWQEQERAQRVISPHFCPHCTPIGCSGG